MIIIILFKWLRHYQIILLSEICLPHCRIERQVGLPEALSADGSVVIIIVEVENCCYSVIIGAFEGSTIEQNSAVSWSTCTHYFQPHRNPFTCSVADVVQVSSQRIQGSIILYQCLLSLHLRVKEGRSTPGSMTFLRNSALQLPIGHRVTKRSSIEVCGYHRATLIEIIHCNWVWHA